MEFKLVILKMNPPSLVFLDTHHLNVDLGCLSSIGNTLKHLVLSGLRSIALPTETITLEQVEVLELPFWYLERHDRGHSLENHQSFVRKVQNNLVFPRLKYLSLSQQDELRPLLDLAEFFVSRYDLEVLALRYIRELHPSEVYRAETISTTCEMIRNKQAGTGLPRRCLLHGPFEEHWLHSNDADFHVEVDKYPNQFGLARYDPDEERARKTVDIRASRLREVDPDGRFCETRHTWQYWKDRRPWTVRYPWHVRNGYY